MDDNQTPSKVGKGKAVSYSGIIILILLALFYAFAPEAFHKFLFFLYIFGN